jgi:hypothetical protein
LTYILLANLDVLKTNNLFVAALPPLMSTDVRRAEVQYLAGEQRRENSGGLFFAAILAALDLNRVMVTVYRRRSSIYVEHTNQ